MHPGSTPSASRPLLQRVAALLVMAGLFAVAAFLVIGGVWLAWIGGSLFYLLCGLALLAIALLLRVRLDTGLVAYALLFVLTLAWALWEAGLDWWPLAVRMDLPFVIGALLLLPWVQAGVAPRRAPRALRRSARILAASLALFVVAAAASWMHDPWTTAGQLRPAPPATATADDVPAGEWHAYGRTGAGQRYSPLAQLTPANVGHLEVAWSYRTGDLRGRPGDPEETTFEATPLKVGNRLFFCTPHQSVVALDATSGQQLWRRDLQIGSGLALQHLTCRGLSYHRADMGAPAEPAAAPASAPPAAGPASLPSCSERLFMPTADGRLLALDAHDGASCAAFGAGAGEIDLWAHMPNVKPGAYYATSPVVVTRRLLIVGGTVLDNASVNEQSGVIRAFDIDSGALVWNWDAARPDDTAPLQGAQTYTPNSPNSWSVSSVDETLGLVYVPMGNQPPDQWGGQRSAAVERYASSVVALDIGTGRARWVFQTVHHDLWDYDVPAQPVLVDLTVRGQAVPALVQPTKQGELFVLDRRTGTPVHAVTETAAPQGAVAGDRTAPTQPVSAISFEPPRLHERDMWGATLLDQLLCRIAFRKLRYEGRFTPPSLGGTLVNPGNFGVFNWGSIAVDPVRRVAFLTPTMIAFTSTLVPRPDDRTLLVQKDGPPQGSLPALNENFGAPFAAKMLPFVSPLGLPCQEPPWGTVAGVDLETGHTAWRHRNGTVRDLSPVPLPFRMGVPSLGGPVITAGGVVFLSGSLDDYVRAYDLTSGRQLWQQRLPAGGQATPMTYLGQDGRQYLVVVAGGHGSTGTRAGDHVIAYALPRAGP